jgi:hypothetical protein
MVRSQRTGNQGTRPGRDTAVVRLGRYAVVRLDRYKVQHEFDDEPTYVVDTTHPEHDVATLQGNVRKSLPRAQTICRLLNLVHVRELQRRLRTRVLFEAVCDVNGKEH